MKRNRSCPACMALSVCLLIAPVLPVAAQAGSPHFDEWTAHENMAWNPAPDEAFRVAGHQPDFSRELVVFGFLPYWQVGDVTLHLDVLTHIAYFGVAIGSDGTPGDTRHWNTEPMNELVAAAHSSGVKVVLTITNFDGASQQTLVNSDTARRTAISNIVALVTAGGGDGVCVDFEGLPVAAKSGFVTFVSDLKDALDAAIGESHVTVATPAVDWKGAYDYDLLADACDGLFLMEYDYHYKGGAPGPLAPLESSDKWGVYSVTWSLDDYDHYGHVENRSKFILGMPLYGYDWAADGEVPPSGFVSSGVAAFYRDCMTQGDLHGWKWDDESASSWYDYYSGQQYRQVWCDDSESLSMRMYLARDRGLGGVGFWALGYEGDYGEPWQAIVNIWGLTEDIPDTSFEDQADGIGETDTVEPDPVGSEFAENPIDDVGLPDSGSPDDVSDTVAAVENAFRSDTAEALETLTDSGLKIDSTDADDTIQCPVCETSGSSCSAGAVSVGNPLPSMLLLVLAVLLFGLTRPILSRRAGGQG